MKIKVSSALVGMAHITRYPRLSLTAVDHQLQEKLIAYRSYWKASIAKGMNKRFPKPAAFHIIPIKGEGGSKALANMLISNLVERQVITC